MLGRARQRRPKRTTRSADKLLPLIDADSRAALWVLVTIYHDLLMQNRAKRDCDVFSQRVSVPTAAKLLILAQGCCDGAASTG